MPRQLVLDGARDGLATAGDLLDRIEAATPPEPRVMLDGARARKGLPSLAEVDAQRPRRVHASMIPGTPARDGCGLGGSLMAALATMLDTDTATAATGQSYDVERTVVAMNAQPQRPPGASAQESRARLEDAAGGLEAVRGARTSAEEWVVVSSALPFTDARAPGTRDRTSMGACRSSHPGALSDHEDGCLSRAQPQRAHLGDARTAIATRRVLGSSAGIGVSPGTRWPAGAEPVGPTGRPRRP